MPVRAGRVKNGQLEPESREEVSGSGAESALTPKSAGS